MREDPLQAAVPGGEALRYSGALRHGGRVGLTDERLLVVREETTSVEFSAVEAVEMEDFDWFVGLLSVLLLGLGLWGLTRNPPLGLLFAAAGVASVYVSYRKRSKATVLVHDRPKPLTLYPTAAGEFYDALGRALATYRERHDLEAADV
jgi:hypothetical protein